MSGKVRVYEVAKQLNIDPKQVVGLFQAIGVVDVRNHMSTVEPDQVERIKRHLEKQRTHDVVEERIRPTVVKRRAVAKPGAPAEPSSPSLPRVPDPPSRPVSRRASVEARPPEPAPSSREPNGHAVSEPADTGRSREDGLSARSLESSLEREPDPVPATAPSARVQSEAAPPPVAEPPAAELPVKFEGPCPISLTVRHQRRANGVQGRQRANDESLAQIQRSGADAPFDQARHGAASGTD